jgi:hypothetical protein
MEQPFGTQLVAGDTWTWRVAPGYSPDDGYTLKLFLRGPQVLDITATSDSGEFVLTALAADTAKLQAGTYGWQMAVFLNADRTEVGRGTIEILADLASQEAGVDSRSWVEQALAAVRAVIAGTASRIESEYQINGRMLRLRSTRELIELESYLGRKLRKIQIDSGQVNPNSNDLRVRFGSTSSRGRGWRS